MGARQTPEDGDIVVHEDARNGTCVYVLYTVPGPDQYLVRARHEATMQALALAGWKRVRVWVSDGDFEFALLRDFRVDVNTTNGDAGASDDDRLKNVPPSIHVTRLEAAMKAAIERVRAEFLEMPGLRLTVRQIQRLFGVDHTTCRAVLDALVGIKFLRVNADGTYMRMWDGQVPHLSPAKADVEPQRRGRAAQKAATG